MVVRASISLDPFEDAFKDYAIKQLKKRLAVKSSSIKASVQEKVQQAVKTLLIQSEAYNSLLGGKLQAELGVTESLQRITSIIDQWADNISVTINTSGKYLLTMEIGVIQSDYEDVLSLPAASYVYATSGQDAGEIPWLRWLLLEGDKRIIRKYSFSPVTRGRRTGLGIMVKNRVSGGQGPPEYSGTASDNFALRALSDLDKKIDEIVEQVIKASL